MIRINDYVEKIALATRNILKKDFKDVYVTTENKDIDKIMKKYKAVVIFNHIPNNEFKRYMNHDIEEIILHTTVYVYGHIENRKYLLDIIDKMTQDLYDGVEFDDDKCTYVDYTYSYEGNPDTGGNILLVGTFNYIIEL